MIGTQAWHNLQCLVQNLTFLLTNKFPARIIPSYVIQVHMPDTLPWNGAPDGRFTVRKGYLFLSGNSSLNSSWPWKRIWISAVPLQGHLFHLVGNKRSCPNVVQSAKKRSNNALCKCQVEDSTIFLIDHSSPNYGNFSLTS